ncbi:NADH-quinone oxidoreductase subunit N [Caldimicrobium thiodismutans]|uniref:NADH-quinone oxidoreductase subunit N n=1 Tax=Caldimicrobium thiodismutans TaxID=1653476 RepID=A0A0U5AH91_9BACT|nr:NADH-quinone oxidoreductase subunit N [Caldimicrobium thiodismutans]BAU23292.1 NADH-quinone oxidoreductase subunit N [Caldimicrobium thiodismutans]
MEVWRSYLPEIFLACASLGILILNSLLIKKNLYRYLGFLFVFILAFFLLLNSFSIEVLKTDLSSHLLSTKAHFLFRIVFLGLGVVLYFSLYNFFLKERYLNEYSFFLGTSFAFLSLIASSQNLLMAFILMEAISFSFYLLISFYKRELLSIEAGLKYFFLGTLSSIFFFTGLFLIYYATLEINLFQTLSKLTQLNRTIYFLLGLILIFSSLAFKLGASPFHFWLPEIYQGSPLPVFPLLAVFSKLGFALFLSNLFLVLFKTGFFSLPTFSTFKSLFYIISLLSMILGNLLALKQKEVKRLLAYSSISHMGYLLTLFAIPLADTNFKLFYGYLFIYSLTNLGIILGFFLIVDHKEIKIPIDSLGNRLKDVSFPLLLSFLILLFSLAGLPPSAGFITKLFLLLQLVKEGAYFLALVFLLASILSLYYYFRLIAPVLSVLKEDSLNLNNRKINLYEIFMLLILVLLSFYLFFSTFKPTLIFFFN